MADQSLGNPNADFAGWPNAYPDPNKKGSAQQQKKAFGRRKSGDKPKKARKKLEFKFKAAALPPTLAAESLPRSKPAHARKPSLEDQLSEQVRQS